LLAVVGHAVSSLCDPAQSFSVASPLVVGPDRSLIKYCLQYSLPHYHHASKVRFGLPGSARPSSVLPIGENMAGRLRGQAKASSFRAPSSGISAAKLSAPKKSAAKTAASTRQEVAPAASRRPATALTIARSIEEDIVLGRRHPRERLIEQDLCDRFHTHRGDVRLALFDLEKKGLVERIPNRGAMVRGLTPAEVREIYAVREELEVMAVRIIRLPVPMADINKLEELQRQHAAAIAAGDLLTVFYSNLRFHQVLFGLCGNASLIETIELLAQKVYGIRSYANAFPKSLDRARRDHVDMIKALRHSRRDELIALTRRHLEPSPEAYIKAYARRFGSSEA
jgi:DNA-binding GntR family transcriptional regulator